MPSAAAFAGSGFGAGLSDEIVVLAGAAIVAIGLSDEIVVLAGVAIVATGYVIVHS